jgi:hypothetical protein
MNFVQYLFISVYRSSRVNKGYLFKNNITDFNYFNSPSRMRLEGTRPTRARFKSINYVI